MINKCKQFVLVSCIKDCLECENGIYFKSLYSPGYCQYIYIFFRSRKIPQSCTNVLQRGTSCNSCIWHHKSSKRILQIWNSALKKKVVFLLNKAGVQLVKECNDFFKQKMELFSWPPRQHLLWLTLLLKSIYQTLQRCPLKTLNSCSPLIFSPPG